MKKAGFKGLRNLAGLCVISLLAPFWLVGCANAPRLTASVQDYGPSYHPGNIYRLTNNLPARIQRVALLPLSTSSKSAVLLTGVETLEPLVYAELEKAKRFEVIPVSGPQMSRWTGQAHWRMDEALPPDFFARAKEATGCDAVLFCQLTRYQPYQPLAIGWKFGLVETPKEASPGAGIKPANLWTADELLDSGDPAVANGARAYYMQHIRYDGPLPDASTILSSPTRFGQYTLSAVLGTMPERTLAPH